MRGIEVRRGSGIGVKLLFSLEKTCNFVMLKLARSPHIFLPTVATPTYLPPPRFSSRLKPPHLTQPQKNPALTLLASSLALDVALVAMVLIASVDTKEIRGALQRERGA